MATHFASASTGDADAPSVGKSTVREAWRTGSSDREWRTFRAAMQQVLRDMNGNESATAQALGVDLQTLRAWLV